MKKIFLVTFVWLAVVLGGSAQIRVAKNGHVSMGPILDAYMNSIDSTVTVSVLGSGPNGSNGQISFGANNRVTIGEYGNSGYNKFMIKTSNGLAYNSGGRTLLMQNADGAFMFGVEVKAPSFLTTSDARLKKDITDLLSFSSSIDLLNPVSYKLAENDNNAIKAKKEDDFSMSVQSDGRTHFGFIAQEVKDIFPELVTEDSEGYLGIDYMGFIPILVDVVKELSKEVASQKEIINELRCG